MQKLRLPSPGPTCLGSDWCNNSICHRGCSACRSKRWYCPGARRRCYPRAQGAQTCPRLSTWHPRHYRWASCPRDSSHPSIWTPPDARSGRGPGILLPPQVWGWWWSWPEAARPALGGKACPWGPPSWPAHLNSPCRTPGLKGSSAVPPPPCPWVSGSKAAFGPRASRSLATWCSPRSSWPGQWPQCLAGRWPALWPGGGCFPGSLPSSQRRWTWSRRPGRRWPGPQPAQSSGWCHRAASFTPSRLATARWPRSSVPLCWQRQNRTGFKTEQNKAKIS